MLPVTPGIYQLLYAVTMSYLTKLVRMCLFWTSRHCVAHGGINDGEKMPAAFFAIIYTPDGNGECEGLGAGVEEDVANDLAQLLQVVELAQGEGIPFARVLFAVARD